VPVSGIGVPTCRSLNFKRTSHQRCELSGMYVLGSAKEEVPRRDEYRYGTCLAAARLPHHYTVGDEVMCR
jgi:hypothetical protein